MDRTIRTVEDVCTLLVQLFRGRGLFGATRSDVESQVNWRRRFLDTDDEAWRALMLRAQCEAEGVPARPRAREQGWDGSRFERAWRRGAARIVRGLETERINAAGLDAYLDADDRLTQAGRIAHESGTVPLFRRA